MYETGVINQPLQIDSRIVQNPALLTTVLPHLKNIERGTRTTIEQRKRDAAEVEAVSKYLNQAVSKMDQLAVMTDTKTLEQASRVSQINAALGTNLMTFA